MPCAALLPDGRVLILLGWDGQKLQCAEGQRIISLSKERLKTLGKATFFQLKELHGSQMVENGATWQGFYKASWAYLANNERQLLGLMALCAGLSYILMLAVPLFTMAVYDRVIPHLAFETLWALAIGVVVALGVDFMLRNVRHTLQDAAGLSLNSYFQGLIVRQLFGARPDSLETSSQGVQQAVREVEGFSLLVPVALVAVAIDFPFFLVLLGFVATLGGPVMLAPLVAVIGVCLLQALSFKKASKSNSELYKQTQERQGLALEMVEGRERIKALGAAGTFSKRWQRNIGKISRTGHESRHLAAVMGQANMVVTQLVIVAVLIIGTYQVAASKMSMGALIACILIIGRSVGPVTAAVISVMRLFHMSGSFAEVNRLIAATQEPGQAFAKPALKANIHFENVTLSYPHAHRPALNGINLTLSEGERVALIGRSGSGKSSLLKMMARLALQSQGIVRLDGYNIEQYPAHEVQSFATYAGQHPHLFAGTVWYNLTYGLENIDTQKLEEICRITGVHRFLADHPEGWGMQLGPNGEGLSGGERQALALSRSLVNAGPLLLLDEPTAAFDTQGEEEFIAAMPEFLNGRTFVLATHRLPVLKLVNRIVVLDKGRIVEDGPKDAILAKLMRASA